MQLCKYNTIIRLKNSTNNYYVTIITILTVLSQVDDRNSLKKTRQTSALWTSRSPADYNTSIEHKLYIYCNALLAIDSLRSSCIASGVLKNFIIPFFVSPSQGRRVIKDRGSRVRQRRRLRYCCRDKNRRNRRGCWNELAAATDLADSASSGQQNSP